MKKIILCTVLLVGFFLASSMYLGMAQAQTPPDLSIWDGSLWQIKQAAKGFYWMPGSLETAPYRKVALSESVYGVLTAEITGTVNLSVFELVQGQEMCEYFGTFPLTYVAGDRLNFATRFNIESGNWNAGLVYFTGTLDGPTLKGGKVESLGTVAIQQDYGYPGDVAVIEITLKGKTIAETKLKCLIPSP